jgi:hypothetical protein
MSTISRCTLEDRPDYYTGWLITRYGNKLWYQEGKLHRLDGPAWEWALGSEEWYYQGKYHRLDGPAWEWALGSEEWYYQGKYHRLDGPAREWAWGSEEWWINGKQITKQTRIVCLI